MSDTILTVDAAPGETATGEAFTRSDHAAICALRHRLTERGSRHTLAADHDFSPEVLEIFAAGVSDAAFVIWREAARIRAIDFRDAVRGTIGFPDMAAALNWVGGQLDAA